MTLDLKSIAISVLNRTKIVTFGLAFSLSLILLALKTSYASETVDLLVWKSTENAPRVILPLIDNEDPSNAVNRYVSHVYKDLDLIKLLTSTELKRSIYETHKLAIPSDTTKPRLLFIANQFEDVSESGERIQRNIKRFASAGADPYVVGLSADIGLTNEQAIVFRNKVAVAFNLLVALGGEDVSEELSGRPRKENSKTIFRRDISELELIKVFKKFGQGLFFGICRGHQIGAIADGHTVIEDLSSSGVGNTHDHVNKMGGSTTEKQTWHHIYVENGSLLARLTGIKNDQSGIVLKVNSIHHQAVSAHHHGHSHVVAQHETSGVEALQMHNGRGISVQFHPEFPPEVSNNQEFSNLGFRLIKNIVAYARLIRSRIQSENQNLSCGFYLR